MSGEKYRGRLRALLRLAGVRRAIDLTDFERAFVHQSYAKEHGGASNDRMEFLGDSVLGCITAGWLFENFADEPEGMLTLRKAAIVNDGQLAQTARRLGFGALTRLGAGMQTAGGADNTSVLADAFEAFVGAIYLRLGLERAARFVVTQHVEQLDHSSDALLDAKTRLQHYTQEHLAATPVYRETSGGTPQRPAFKSRVSVKGKILGRGEGFSKKAAQQAAAQAALLFVTERLASEAAGGPRRDSRRGGEVPKAKAQRQSVAQSAARLK
ncbi:MAG: ribonuclease III [Candidatus Cybelea sp.]